MQTILEPKQRQLLNRVTSGISSRQQEIKQILSCIKPRSGFCEWSKRMKWSQEDHPFALGYRASKAYYQSGKTLRYPQCPYEYGTFEAKRWARGFFTFDNEYHES